MKNVSFFGPQGLALLEYVLITGSTHSSADTLRVTTPYGGPRAGGKDSTNSKRFPNNHGQNLIQEQMPNESDVLGGAGLCGTEWLHSSHGSQHYLSTVH